MPFDDLHLTPDAAEACARACRTFADGVSQLRKHSERIPDHMKFGTLPSGQALARKYSELAVGGEGSLDAMLSGHIDVAERLARTFEEMGRRYAETDAAVADSIRNHDGPR